MTPPEPLLTVVVAMDRNRLIGAAGGLPWHLPADLAHFKRLTLDGTLLMGRRTFESIGRPLTQRRSVVISRDPGYRAEGCTVAGSPEAGIAAAAPAAEVFVIGGADLFAQLLPRCRRIHLTEIHHTFEGDTWMPPFGPGWRETARTPHEADPRNPYPYSFVTLERD
ncbi:MAG: dihydrofolate reductase [Ectothiorhodospira sp.]